MTEATKLAAAAHSGSPEVGLAAVAALRRLLESLEDLQVQHARELGWSWQDIAEMLGVSRQAVHKKHAGGRLSKDPQPPWTPSPTLPSDIVSRLRAAGCVFAEDEARLLISGARSPADLDGMVDRRVAGLPLEHVLGWAEFCGLRMAVDPGVFVPRRRSEFLVRQAAGLARPAGRSSGQPAVVDLCCGSGAVGVALAVALGRVELHAVDIDPAAVRCARRNVAPGGGHVYEGDLYDPLPAPLRGGIDIVVANAPYVPTDAIGLLPAEARLHEPRIALDGGTDGLDVQRRMTAAAPHWLAPGGHLLIETSAHQAARTVTAFAQDGLIPTVATSDELHATVVIGTRPDCDRP